MGTVQQVVIFAVTFGITFKLINEQDGFHSSVISGKRVLITGASSGIGEQLAYQYAKNGADVFITARRENLLEKVIDKCKQIGSKTANFGYFAADMSKMEQIEQVVSSSVEQLGGLDVVLINHALLSSFKNPKDLQEAMKKLQTYLKVNTEGPAYIAGLILPYLVKSQGSFGIVNSIAGKISSKYGRAYSASKFALDAYFTSLRDEIKEANVSVTNVVLGAIGTEMARGIFDEADKSLGLPSIKFITQSPEDTAEFIMKGVANRENEIYFPTYLNYIIFFREIIARLDILKYLL